MGLLGRRSHPGANCHGPTRSRSNPRLLPPLRHGLYLVRRDRLRSARRFANGRSLRPTRIDPRRTRSLPSMFDRYHFRGQYRTLARANSRKPPGSARCHSSGTGNGKPGRGGSWGDRILPLSLLGGGILARERVRASQHSQFVTRTPTRKCPDRCRDLGATGLESSSRGVFRGHRSLVFGRG